MWGHSGGTAFLYLLNLAANQLINSIKLLLFAAWPQGSQGDFLEVQAHVFWLLERRALKLSGKDGDCSSMLSLGQLTLHFLLKEEQLTPFLISLDSFSFF